MVTLDVGCGDKPHGDVNIDVCVGYTLQGGDQETKGIVIDPKSIENFIQAHAQFLPFRDGTFERVVSYHTIEHVENPLHMLGELIRVSKREVEVVCPHRYSKGAKMPFHQHVFSKTWFVRVLSNLSVEYKIDVTLKPLISAFVPIIMRPSEIKVVIEK